MVTEMRIKSVSVFIDTNGVFGMMERKRVKENDGNQTHPKE
jgi:hypothetical protein